MEPDEGKHNASFVAADSTNMQETESSSPETPGVGPVSTMNAEIIILHNKMLDSNGGNHGENGTTNDRCDNQVAADEVLVYDHVSENTTRSDDSGNMSTTQNKLDRLPSKVTFTKSKHVSNDTATHIETNLSPLTTSTRLLTKSLQRMPCIPEHDLTQPEDDKDVDEDVASIDASFCEEQHSGSLSWTNSKSVILTPPPTTGFQVPIQINVCIQHEMKSNTETTTTASSVNPNVSVEASELNSQREKTDSAHSKKHKVAAPSTPIETYDVDEEESCRHPEVSPLVSQVVDEVLEVFRRHQLFDTASDGISRTLQARNRHGTRGSLEDGHSLPKMKVEDLARSKPNVERMMEQIRQMRREEKKDINNSELSQEDFFIRIRLFQCARMLRRERNSIKPFGIFGLYNYLCELRLDLEWAEDAAWRRKETLPYLSWIDFEHRHAKAYQTPIFTYLMMLVCTVVLITSFSLDGWEFAPVNVNPLLGPTPEALLRMGALDTSRIVELNEWWRIFSAVVLYAGIIHYCLNMIILWIVGVAVEQVHGTVEVAVVFLMSAFCANIASALFMPQSISVGASGGIFALLGMCVVDIVVNWDLIQVANDPEYLDVSDKGFPYTCAVLLLCLDTILNFMVGLTPFVDNFAHIGGFFYGSCLSLSLVTSLGSSGFFGQRQRRLAQVRKSGCNAFRIVAVVASGVVFSVTFFSLFQLMDGPYDMDKLCPYCRYMSCVPFPFWTPEEDRWWNCDGCELSKGQLFTYDGKNAQLSLYCPLGRVVSVELNESNPNEVDIRLQLSSYCREYCHPL